MLKHIKEYEELNINPIDIEKLKSYAKGIMLCCNGEYGEVFYNLEENHIFVCLGDSHPFDTDSLEVYFREAVYTNYSTMDSIKITIENECYPNGENWTIYRIKDNDFHPWTYR